jgi:hypothetical protein
MNARGGERELPVEPSISCIYIPLNFSSLLTVIGILVL